jgi:hypothetical protein
LAVTPVIVSEIIFAEVVTFRTLLAFEILLAASLALTVMEYVVAGERPVIFAEVPVTVFTREPFLYTRYAVTPILSVEAFHDKVKLEVVILLEESPEGTVGA